MKCRIWGIVALACLVSGTTVFAKDGDAPAKAKPAEVAKPAEAAKPVVASKPKQREGSLSIFQRSVSRMMAELDVRFTEVARDLEATEPDRSRRLITTLQKSKELSVEPRMRKIAELIDSGDYDEAGKLQAEVMAHLKQLVKMLLEDPSEWEKKQKEIEKLEGWKKSIQQLMKDQIGQKRESEKVGDRDKALADLGLQIKRLEGLIKEQEKVVGDAGKAKEEGAQKLTKVSEDQGKVKEGTKQLGEEIAGQSKDEQATPGEQKPGEGKPSEGKPGEGKPMEGKPGEGKPMEGKPGEGKPGEGKPMEGKPGEGKPGEGKGGEGKGGEGKGGEGKGGEGKGGEGKGGEGKGGEGKGGEGKGGEGKQGAPKPQSPKPPQVGEEAVKKAVEHQENAEKDLNEGKGKAGEAEAQKALVELNKALEALKQEKARIASLPPKPFDKMAQKQEETADKTAKLEAEMKQDAKESSQSGSGKSGEGKPGEGQPGEGQPGESGEQKESPGQKSVEQAQKNMQKAADKLKKEDPKKAAKDQKDAASDLEKALQEIEERLAQLREQMQIEKLAKLEARFTEMLHRQKVASAATKDLDKTLIANGNLTRPEKARVTGVATEERALSEMTQQALDIIIEDGTSVVFAQVVGQLRDDFNSVADLVQGQRIDAYTQSMQKSIEETLEELIAALQKAQQDKQEEQESKPGEGKSGEQEEPLLPGSAELKLLRSAQLRVNNRTAAFDKARADRPLDGLMQKELKNIANRQEEAAEMALKLLERN